MLATLTKLFSKPAPSPEVIEYGKNPACQEMIARTNAIVFDALPKGIKAHVGMLEEYKEFIAAGLMWQARHARWRIQCEAAKSLGLDLHDAAGAAKLLTGKDCKLAHVQHWREIKEPDSNRGLWLNRMNLDTADVKSEAVRSLSFVQNWADERHRIIPNGWPAFQATKEERIMFGSPEELRVPISRGAVLRLGVAREFTVNGLHIFSGGKPSEFLCDTKKSAYLFDGFAILAPEDCWLAPANKDPILFGVIAGPINRAEKSFMDRYVPLARWE